MRFIRGELQVGERGCDLGSQQGRVKETKLFEGVNVLVLQDNNSDVVHVVMKRLLTIDSCLMGLAVRKRELQGKVYSFKFSDHMLLSCFWSTASEQFYYYWVIDY